MSGFEYSDKSKVGMEAKPSINEKEFAVYVHTPGSLLSALLWMARESFGCYVEKGKACPYTYLAHDVDLLLRLLIRLLIPD